MRIKNLDWSKCQRQPLEVFREKGCSLKCHKLLPQSQYLPVLQIFEEHLFYRTTPDDYF